MATIEKRKGKNGKDTYRIKIRLKGMRQQISESCPNLTIARRRAAELETEIRNGRFTRVIEARKHTVGEAIERYLREVLPYKTASMQMQGAQLKEWSGMIGHVRLDDVSSSLLSQCRDQIQNRVPLNCKGPKDNASFVERRKNTTVNRYLAALSHVFSIAVREWEWLESNPLLKVRRFREQGRERTLSKEERERLLEECDRSACRSLGLIVRIALATGLRKQEILNLHWVHVNLETGRLVVDKTKNGDKRSAFLTEPTLGLLRRHSRVRSLRSNLLFPSPNNESKSINFETSWRSALRAAQLDDLVFHDLRHEFATRLAEEGASLPQLSLALGHRTLQMVRRYSHLADESIREVVGNMNKRVSGE